MRTLVLALGFVVICTGCLLGPASPVRGAEAEKAAEWQVYRPAGATFTVEFPCKADDVMRRRAGRTTLFMAETKDAGYVVSYGEIGADAGRPPAQVIREAEGVRAGSKWSLSESKDITFQGSPGRESIGRDRDRLLVIRTYLIKNMLIQLLVTTAPARRDHGDTQRFLQSLALVDPATAPPAGPSKTPAPGTSETAPPKPPKTPAPAPGTSETAPPKPPRQPRQPRSVERPAADDALVAKAVEDLGSGDLQRAKSAAARLKRVDPGAQPRGDVAKGLLVLLASEDSFARCDGLKALAVWHTAEVVPEMIACTKDKEFNVRGAALEALGQVKDVRAAEAAAQCMETERGDAERALTAMGPLAEPAVLKRLTHADLDVRVAACKVLAEIGTARSVAALKPLASDKEPAVRSAAADALKAISSR